MNNPNILILIPARFGSSRFPGKPLAEIKAIKKTVIQRVFENCKSTGFTACVVTDSDKIEQHIKEIGGNVVRVDDPVSSGSERITLAYERFFKDQKFDLIINVQGDEPLLDATELKRLAEFHLNSKFDIATLVRPMKGFDEEFTNPNHVKVIYSKAHGICHYFSRAPIPYMRNPEQARPLEEWFLHIGVYSYRPNALLEFSKNPMSYYESMEKLEQLRALELGFEIGAITTDRQLVGVDTPEDLAKLEKVFINGDK